MHQPQIYEQHCEILLYLDSKNVIQEMKNCCSDFIQLNEKTTYTFSPLRFILKIDVMDLFNACPEAGELLTSEPLQWNRICNEIFFKCLQTIQNDWVGNVQSTQVAVNLRLKSIPRNFEVSRSKIYNGLYYVRGILLSLSQPESYAYHTVWSCPEDCDGNEVVLHYMPKVPPRCSVCKSILFENKGYRRCGEQVSATFKLTSDGLARKFTVVDDLIPTLRPGMRYIIIATVLKKTITVLGIEENLTLIAPLTAPIPEDIAELFKCSKGIAWKFIYSLASSIGVNICPLNCFMHLKICLLISLTSVKANALTGSAIVHVLAAGYDTGYVGELMIEASSMADRAVTIGTSNTTVSTALVVSSGGVCVMPLPLHCYSQKLTSLVVSNLETGEVVTENTTVKLQSAVWAQGLDFKKINLQNVASVFGTMCRGDYGECVEEIAEFVLHNSINPFKKTEDEAKALKDLVAYIDLVSGINVTMDKESESVLREYFLTIRREGRREISVSSMGSLAATCINSARLCRRTTTNIEDAILAVWLHVSGGPEPRIAPEEHLDTSVDLKALNKQMKKFKEWLEKFIGGWTDMI